MKYIIYLRDGYDFCNTHIQSISMLTLLSCCINVQSIIVWKVRRFCGQHIPHFCLQMDSVLYAEFLMWREHPSCDRSSAFLRRIYREDIGPCLSFTRSEVTIPLLLGRNMMLLYLSHFSVWSHVNIICIPAPHSCPSWCRVPWKTTLWPSSPWPCQRYRWLRPQL